MDISGADAAEKLDDSRPRSSAGCSSIRRRCRSTGIGGVEPGDIAAAAAFDGAIRPVAQASWHGRAIHAFVGPAFVGGTHPLARVSGVTNGIVIVPRRRGQRRAVLHRPGRGPRRHRRHAAGRRGGADDGAPRADAVAGDVAAAPRRSRGRTRRGSCGSTAPAPRIGCRRSPRLVRHLDDAARAARRSHLRPHVSRQLRARAERARRAAGGHRRHRRGVPRRASRSAAC